MRMTQEEFDRENRYQGLMYFVNQMRRDGLITAEEYCEISTEYARKLSPKTGTLLALNDLLSSPKRVIYGGGKEAKSLENTQD